MPPRSACAPTTYQDAGLRTPSSPTYDEIHPGTFLVSGLCTTLFLVIGHTPRPGIYCVLGPSVTFGTYRLLTSRLAVRTYILLDASFESGIYIVYTFADSPTPGASP